MATAVFRFTARPVARGPAGTQGGAATGPPPGVPVPHPIDPLWELLLSLRGRSITLQVGGVRHQGRLVTSDPLVLVRPDGQAVMIRFGAVQAIEF